jgi:hypothetical protein
MAVRAVLAACKTLEIASFGYCDPGLSVGKVTFDRLVGCAKGVSWMSTKLLPKLFAFTILAPVLAGGAAQATTLSDGSFETQGAASGISGSYCYGGGGSGETACASGAWSFTTLVPGSVGDGIISQTTGGNPNSSAWGAPVTGANGNYFAFVQINGSFSQTFTATSSGSYLLTWIDATRSNYGGNETYTVLLTNNTTPGSITIATYTPTNTAFASVGSSVFSLIDGDSYTVTFQGVDPSLIDQTAFIDNVNISATPLPASLPLFAGGLGLIGLVGGAWKRRKAQTA